MLCIESIRISHAQYPSGNCHVSSKFVSFFPHRRKNRNIWVKIRAFLASPRDTFFTILQSLLELIGIISTEMQIMLTVDLRLSVSLSLLSYAECFSMSFLYVIAHLLGRAIGKITRFRWEATKAADAKGWAQRGKNIAWKKTSILPLGGKDIDRFWDQKGSRITINYTWFEKISSRNEIPIFRAGNSPRKFNLEGVRSMINISYCGCTASILFQKRKFFCYYTN